MEKNLIIISGNDPGYQGRVMQLACAIRESGLIPMVIDLTRLNSGFGNEYNDKVLRFFRATNPITKFHKHLIDLGIELIYPTHSESAITIDNESKNEILDACESAIISYARDPNPNLKSRGLKNINDRLLKGGCDSYLAVLQSITKFQIKKLLVPNGRFPHQRASVIAALDTGIEVNYYEKGDFSESIYLQSYSTLDRIKSQQDVVRILDKYDSETVTSVGAEWFASRIPSETRKGSNIYARNFDSPSAGLQSDNLGGENWIGIFTSSQDEFLSLGKEWHLHEWENQYSAIRLVLEEIDDSKNVYLRIHPNLATKSHKAFKNELCDISALHKDFPHLKIFMHDEKINSYELIKKSSHVVVWDSTIGLEALAMGVNVIELAASYYDDYTLVNKCFSKSDLSEIFQKCSSPNPDRAIKFAAYLSLRETLLTDSARQLIREFDISDGIRKKLLRIATMGGSPSVRIAGHHLIDTLRHRSFKTNLKYLFR